jgi:hypothetical protein
VVRIFEAHKLTYYRDWLVLSLVNESVSMSIQDIMAQWAWSEVPKETVPVNNDIYAELQFRNVANDALYCSNIPSWRFNVEQQSCRIPIFLVHVLTA